MASELALPRLQRWMQAVIVHAGTVVEATASPEAQAELPAEKLPEVILPSRTLEPEERLEIYHGMYLLRMVEALEADYPALQHFLGDDGFRELVRGYVQAHPSRSYSLNPLGKHLPEYVRRASGVRRREFCYDLARLELAVTEVFDEVETPALTEQQIAEVPPEAWERARLAPIAAFRLLAFRYPVNEYLQTVRDDNHDHPRPRVRNNWVAVYRRQYGVYRLDLTRPAHDLLADLVGGRPLGEAVAAALRRGGRRAPNEQDLFRWFREWAMGGVFRSVSID
jgi:hypothetical protein